MILLELKDVRKSYGYDENKVNAMGAANQLYYTSWVDLPNHSKGLSY